MRTGRVILLALFLVLLGGGGTFLTLGDGNPRVAWEVLRLGWPFDARVRAAGADRLGEMGEAARPAVPALAARLRDEAEDDDVRRSAAQALGELGEVAEQATPTMRAVLTASRDTELACVAAWALVKAGVTDAQVISTATRCLESDERFGWMALEALGPAAAPAVPALVRHLETGGRANAAAWVLGRIGPAAAPAVPALVRALEQSEPGEGGGFARTLGILHAASPAVVDALGAYLERAAAEVAEHDPGPYVDLGHVAASDALAELGPAARGAVPRLRAAYRVLPAEHRWSVVRALAAVAPSDGGGILPSILRRYEAGDREEAVRLLLELGPAAEPATPLLVAALEDEDTRFQAALTLAEIGTPPAIAALRELRGHESATARTAAVYALGVASRERPTLLQELLPALADSEPLVAADAAIVLSRSDEEAAFALPALDEAAARGVPQAAEAARRIREALE